MFELFFSLYLAMFRGTYVFFGNYQISNLLTNSVNKIGTLLTSMFNDNASTMDDLGDTLLHLEGSSDFFMTIHALIAFILALITSIGIVVMAVKGVKKAFGIFFMGLRS